MMKKVLIIGGGIAGLTLPCPLRNSESLLLFMKSMIIAKISKQDF